MGRQRALYERLLKLYPKPYRDHYGEQMAQTLDDMLADQPSQTGRLLVWLRVGLDLAVTIAGQQLMYVGGIMKNETPVYLKRNALIGAVLLVPFWIVIAVNSLNQHAVGDSTVWKRTLWVLLVILPAAAFLLNVGTFMKWAVERKVPLWKSLFDVSHNWPMLLIAGLGLAITLFVPFHDSVHCVTGNPIQELQNWHDTWRCIQKG